MSIMYVRLAEFGSVTDTSILALTPTFLIPHDPAELSSQGIDEYISIASSGCLIYACYPQCESESGYDTTNMYISRISICPADVDDNGRVEPGDVSAFGIAFSSQAPAADVNRDGVCTGTDAQYFLNAYTCGCGTPQ
jgi:hypothetical protein